MKRKVVIVGAGLAGSVLAARLKDSFEVVVVDLGSEGQPFVLPMVDADQPARLWPHVGSGQGGTTNFWNNGLIELEDDDFAQWPFDKNELDDHYSAAYRLLTDSSLAAVRNAHARVTDLYRQRGVPQELLANSLFYPRTRLNIWKHLENSRGDIRFVVGRALYFRLTEGGRVTELVLNSPSGEMSISGDIFISSAGGLSSPLLVQATADRAALGHLPAIGRHYHDHPSGPVGQVKLNLEIYDLWDFSPPGLGGNIRLPFVVRTGGLKFAFQLRPVVALWPNPRRQKVRSVLTDLRNFPLSPRNYLRFIANSDDIFDFMSFKFGWKLPTHTFSVWVTAEQYPGEELAVTCAADGSIVKRWNFSPDYVKLVGDALQNFFSAFGPRVVYAYAFPNAISELTSGAHHSGTCRMAASADVGVCDANGRVFGIENLFICDGSVLPRSGYANTGLTIAALALRLAATLRKKTEV
jgi:hypothetical protein